MQRVNEKIGPEFSEYAIWRVSHNCKVSLKDSPVQL